MERRDQHHDDVNSPRSFTDGQWSPPPQFQEHDQIYASHGSPQAYSPYPNSPPQGSTPHGSPPIHGYPEEYQQSSQNSTLQNSTLQTQSEYQPGYQHGYQPPYLPGKETPYATHEISGTLTPDYSGPQVVPGQFHGYNNAGRPFSPSSHGGTTLTSPHIRPYTFKEHVDADDPIVRPDTPPPPVPPKDDRKCGLKKRTFYIVCAGLILAILALALGLGLGLGLKKKNESGTGTDPFCREKPEYCIGGALNANYFSKKGAFNGTGIALAGESWNTGQRRIFTLYFQHHTGDIRFMQYTTDQKWIGGSKAQTVVTDAKDGSPISAVAYALNATQYVTQTNVTNIWQPGPLNDLNLKALDSPSAGLQACWKGNYYGDSDFSKFPTASGQVNQQRFEDRLGMNIWFALDDSTFQQYAWYNGQDTWVPIQRWPGFNAHAGVGCYSWGEGTTTYAMMANKQNDVEFWWKDTNVSTPSQDYHPINSWQNSSRGAIRGVHPITSLGYTTYFYAQMADRSIKGYNITYQAENTTFVQDQTFTITDPAGPARGLGGTHLTVTAYAEKDGNTTKWDSLYVFYQTAGDDISAFTRRLAGGEWTKGTLNIPDN